MQRKPDLHGIPGTTAPDLRVRQRAKTAARNEPASLLLHTHGAQPPSVPRLLTKFSCSLLKEMMSDRGAIRQICSAL